MAPTGPRLLDQVRARIRFKHYSLRTEQAYVDWIKRFIRFHGNRHPSELSASDVEQFLTHLASELKVAASTQNQAQSALLFLYRQVLGRELPWLDGVVRAKAPTRLPTVLTRSEVARLLNGFGGNHRLLAELLYGTGMRILEAVRLRVKDVDLERREILVRDGKGAKDRVTMLPDRLVGALRRQLRAARATARDGPAAKDAAPSGCRSRSSANIRAAARDWGWQYVFPADRRSIDPRSGIERRHHISDQSVPARDARSRSTSGHRQAGYAAHACGIRSRPICSRRATTSGRCRSCWATRDVSTTMIYTHVLNRGGRGVVSPLDRLIVDPRESVHEWKRGLRERVPFS